MGNRWKVNVNNELIFMDVIFMANLLLFGRRFDAALMCRLLFDSTSNFNSNAHMPSEREINHKNWIFLMWIAAVCYSGVTLQITQATDDKRWRRLWTLERAESRSLDTHISIDDSLVSAHLTSFSHFLSLSPSSHTPSSLGLPTTFSSIPQSVRSFRLSTFPCHTTIDPI